MKNKILLFNVSALILYYVLEVLFFSMNPSRERLGLPVSHFEPTNLKPAT